jgi:hypothetical protein
LDRKRNERLFKQKTAELLKETPLVRSAFF